MTHLYELYQIKDIYDDTKWKWQESLDDTRLQNKTNGSIKYLRDIIYLSLPHEINARLSSLFGYLYMNLKRNCTEEKIKDVLMKSREWESYITLLNFNDEEVYNGLIEYFSNMNNGINFLFLIFNELNNRIGLSIEIKNLTDIRNYLKTVKKITKKRAYKFKKKMDRLVKNMFNDLNETIVYSTQEPSMSYDYKDYFNRRENNLNYINELSEYLIEFSNEYKRNKA